MSKEENFVSGTETQSKQWHEPWWPSERNVGIEQREGSVCAWCHFKYLGEPHLALDAFSDIPGSCQHEDISGNLEHLDRHQPHVFEQLNSTLRLQLPIHPLLKWSKGHFQCIFSYKSHIPMDWRAHTAQRPWTYPQYQLRLGQGSLTTLVIKKKRRIQLPLVQIRPQSSPQNNQLRGCRAETPRERPDKVQPDKIHAGSRKWRLPSQTSQSSVQGLTQMRK